MESAARSKGVAANIALVLSSVAICLLIMEAWLRWSGYGVLGTRQGNVVHHVTTDFAHYAHLNSLGLRDDEVGPKQPQEIRILIVGDSFTYGFGVEEPATFVRRTEAILQKHAPPYTQVRVINGGVGNGPAKQGNWLREVGLYLEPAIVVQNFYIGNDIYDDLAWSQTARRPNDYVGSGLDGRLLTADWIWNHLVHISFFDKIMFDLGLRYRDRGLFLKDESEIERKGWAAVAANLSKIHRLLRENNIAYLVMMTPTVDQVRYGNERSPEENYTQPNERLAKILLEEKIDFIDLLPSFESNPNKDTFYYHRDLHWTAAGHLFAAELLADRLRPMLEDMTRDDRRGLLALPGPGHVPCGPRDPACDIDSRSNPP